MKETLTEEKVMKKEDLLALQKCSCGDRLEYKEEQFTKMCWCCSMKLGKDIGAIYYYSTGIWKKPAHRKYHKRPRKYEKGR